MNESSVDFLVQSSLACICVCICTRLFCVILSLVCYFIRLLGTRIAELEHRLKVLEISGLWSTPDNGEEDVEREKQPAISWEEEEEEEEEVVLVEEDKNGSLVQGIIIINN